MASSLSYFITSNLNPHIGTSKTKHIFCLPKAMKVATSNKTCYWSSVNADVKEHLEKVLPIHEPLVVHKSVHQVIFSTPESMAPALCIAVCELFEGPRADALVVASAINLMLAAIYSHQHLPHLLERQSPQILPHNVELMSGDAIIPLGFELLSSSNGMKCDSTRILRVIVEIARAMGAQGVVEGQYMHINWAKGASGEGTDDEKALKRVCEKKEGMIYGCAAACGAIVGGAMEEEIERLRNFGFYVGMVYGMSAHGTGREEIQGLKSMALEELNGFDVGKLGDISSLLGGAN